MLKPERLTERRRLFLALVQDTHQRTATVASRRLRAGEVDEGDGRLTVCCGWHCRPFSPLSPITTADRVWCELP